MAATPVKIRWRTAEDEAAAQAALFAEGELVDRHVGIGEYRGLEFFHVNARRIINEVPGQSRMPFRYTINAYRGCSHACSFCFARPTHDYLGLNIGDDFDRRIVVKVNAVERLAAELRSPRWQGEGIAMGTNTDPYQRAEGKYHLTQGIIRVLGEHANPFSILTKSTLILRDLDLLIAAAKRTDVRVNFSIASLDETHWKEHESGAPHPRRRVEAVRRLNDAGIACGVLMAPILPGISDRPEQLAETVEACVEAGAVSIAGMPLHLRGPVRAHFLSRLGECQPELVEAYERLYTRAYLPAAKTRAVSQDIRALVAAARSRTRRRNPPRIRPAPSTPSPANGEFSAHTAENSPSTEGVVGDQLSFGL